MFPFKIELKEGYVSCQYLTDEIDLYLIKLAEKERLRLTKGKVYPVLIEDFDLKRITKEARDYFGSDLARKGVLCRAMMINNKFSEVFGTFIKLVNSPQVKIEFFKNREEAVKWMRDMHEETVGKTL